MVGTTLPPQMIPLSEKTGEWRMDTMDALESIARAQYSLNMRLVENYEMIKGKFIPTHYYGDEGYNSLLNQLSKEFELPNYLRHYDIISPVINTLMGEWAQRPDTFKVKDWSEKGQNQFKRAKLELLTQYVQEQINLELNKKIIALGLDQQKPTTEEEAKQLQEQIDSLRTSLTPPDIESYMRSEFLTPAEIWGSARLAADKQKFNIDEFDRKQFLDMLASDRVFRHYWLTSTGYDIEVWNPVNTFYHKSPDLDYIENGDYVGRIFTLTLSDIIDRYGFKMTKDQLESLTSLYKKDKTKWNEVSGSEYVYNNYMVPFTGFPAYSAIQNSIQTQSGDQLPYLDSNILNTSINDVFSNRNGYYTVVEAYWKSQERITLITYFDEELGYVVRKLVDEHYIIPDHFVESKFAFSEEQDINTYVHTYVNRVWKGIKINLGSRENSIYLDMIPAEFQFKGDQNIYGAKLPVCGQVFSPRNSSSMSLVDLMKPHQIGYNLSINQLYNLAEKEIGAFMVFDVNMFVNSKDWGGEDSWEKWMTVAKSLSMVPIDSSPQNIKGATSAAGGQLPKILDLNLASQMVSRMNIAKFFEEQAHKQVGFNQYRLGNFTASSTATGIQQGGAQSQAQTETYFTQFSNYLRRCYRMHLDIAQYVDSKQKDITITYTDSMMSNAFINILGTDLLLSDLFVFVSNSQEQLRQLESLRQLGLNNNTAGASISDLAEIITTNSPANILKLLKESDLRKEAMEQNAAAAQQASAQKELELETAKLHLESEQFDKRLENELKIAEINANSRLFFNRNYSPSESDIKDAKENLDSERLDREMEHKNAKLISDKDIKQQELALKNKEIDAKIAKEKSDIEYAKIMKKK